MGFSQSQTHVNTWPVAQCTYSGTESPARDKGVRALAVVTANPRGLAGLNQHVMAGDDSLPVVAGR